MKHDAAFLKSEHMNTPLNATSLHRQSHSDASPETIPPVPDDPEPKHAERLSQSIFITPTSSESNQDQSAISAVDAPSIAAQNSDSKDENGTTQPISIHDFTLIREIGHGSCATVYLARDFNGNMVAIRKFTKRLDDKQTIQHERVQTELNVFRVAHGCWIPDLYYFFESETDYYFVMEYLSGGTLNELFHPSEPLPAHQTQFLLAEITAAVSHLHQFGIVHKDLKPENIMIDSKGHIRLIDFEFACFLENLSPDETIRGTWGFLAPEVLDRQAPSFANDWWAVGVIAYKAHFGHLPFDNRNLDRLRRLVMESPPWIPRSTPVKIASLIRGLLAKEPEKRIGSGSNDPMSHEYFEGIDWLALQNEESSFPVVGAARLGKPEDWTMAFNMFPDHRVEL
jgi:serine/threonine protein kinase